MQATSFRTGIIVRLLDELKCNWLSHGNFNRTLPHGASYD